MCKKLALFLLMLGFASSARAWQPGMGAGPMPMSRTFDPFTYGASSPSAYPGDNYYDDFQSLPAADPQPENPVRDIYEDGKIIVVVGTDRHFGYRIGDAVKLVMLVAAESSVKLDFKAIKQGQFGLDGSDFEMAAPAVLTRMGESNGMVIYRLDLQVRSFVYKDGVTSFGAVFTADFLYAVEMAPDGKTPNWKRLTTPGIFVTRSNTADNGDNLLEGDLGGATDRISWFTYPLLLTGLVLLLFWPTVLIMRYLMRVSPRRKIPANELAWSVFDRVIADGKRQGFTIKHYKQIASALRVFLGVEARTVGEIEVLLRHHKDIDLILSALSKFDSTLYDKGRMSDAELRQLDAELKALVPRP